MNVARKPRNQESPRVAALRYGKVKSSGKIVSVDFGRKEDAWDQRKRSNQKLASFLGLKT